MKNMKLLATLLVLFCITNLQASQIEQGFRKPPLSAKPWVMWHWINGNVTKDGITKDLEALSRVGIGGVIQMEVSGPQWAPDGPVKAHSREAHELIQWAISEAARVGMEFDVNLDYGYGSGGPHITPDKSMQQLVCSETEVSGGRRIRTKLKRPSFSYDKQVKAARLKRGRSLNPKVLEMLEEVDSYRDVAVIAIALPSSKEGQAYRIANIKNYNGLNWRKTDPKPLSKLNVPEAAVIAFDKVIDLSDHMQKDGTIDWRAPLGNWQILRIGHASNFKMTRPSPADAVGLECDRLNPVGIEAHFEYYLRPIFDNAGDHAGETLKYMFLDSWEAHGQNWTSGFEQEFKKRRGYDILPWLPVLTGRVVGSPKLSDRFLWDMRLTVSEVMLDNYVGRLCELARPYGVLFSNESYGSVCADSLTFGGRVDFPVCEFWTEFNQDKFPQYKRSRYTSMNATASIANTYGKKWVGAEAFTGARGWMDHPYSLKGMGDEAFCNGVNKFTIHSSTHQAYDRMRPGLTHRKWSQNFCRHQTWWEFSKPYFDYISRSQFLLQQGHRVADVACLYIEGAPLHYNDLEFTLPDGYNFDLCSAEIIQRMEMKDGRIHLPTGVSYDYLVLPKSGKITMETASKVDSLKKAGARIVLQSPIQGTPGMDGYPESDRLVKRMAKQWDPDRKLAKGWQSLFEKDSLEPDFAGGDLHYIHRRTPDMDIYFVANTNPEPIERNCSFRVTGSLPELWDPESGNMYRLDHVKSTGEISSVSLRFEPFQSWFVVFKKDGPDRKFPAMAWPEVEPIQNITGPWSVSFDPDWGGPKEPVKLDQLMNLSLHPEDGIKYYSGTVTYTKSFSMEYRNPIGGRLLLDLGNVEVIARISLNGKPCETAWKYPYRVDVTNSIRAGTNELKIEVANTWMNRLIGDEQLPLDADWNLDKSKNVIAQSLDSWPDWFLAGKESPTGRYTLTSSRHYTKDSPLTPSGLLGPVSIVKTVNRNQLTPR